MLLEELKTAKQYIQENLDKGFIILSQAPFALLILMVRKHNGALCLCVNYWKLNAITKKDQYLLPLINKLLEQLSKAKIFTKINICQGFHRIQIHLDSEDMTIFRTRYGSYKYKVMPLRLTNRPATFQHYVNNTFMDYLDDFLTAFVDNLLIYSNNEIKHKEHV
jgi:hypothetical protein